MFSPNISIFTILRSLSIFFYYPVIIAAMVFGKLKSFYICRESNKPDFCTVYHIWPLVDLNNEKKLCLRNILLLCIYCIYLSSIYFYKKGVEICTAKWRKYYGMAINACFGLGCILLSIFAYFIRDWKILQLCITCYILIYLGVSFILPKSPR